MEDKVEKQIEVRLWKTLNTRLRSLYFYFSVMVYLEIGIFIKINLVAISQSKLHKREMKENGETCKSIGCSIR